MGIKAFGFNIDDTILGNNLGGIGYVKNNTYSSLDSLHTNLVIYDFLMKYEEEACHLGFLDPVFGKHSFRLTQLALTELDPDNLKESYENFKKKNQKEES